MQSDNLAIMTSVLILVFVIDLIRRQKMTFKYSMLWLSTALVAILFSVNQQLLLWLSAVAGFSLPSNFVFFLLLVFFIVVCLFLTVYVNEQNTRTESLAQSVAILEHKIKELRLKALPGQSENKTPSSRD